MDESVSYELVPFQNRRELETFFTTNEFCVTGAGFAHLLENESKFLRQVLPHIRVYARMAPKQKVIEANYFFNIPFQERVINELKSIGKVTLMCGDGTNDVGALKHANVGREIGMFSTFSLGIIQEWLFCLILTMQPKWKRRRRKERRRLTRRANSLHKERACLEGDLKHLTMQGLSERLKSINPFMMYPGRAISPAAAAAQSKLEKMMKELEEEDRAQVVKLGDASIAAPFTSKYTSIASSKCFLFNSLLVVVDKFIKTPNLPRLKSIWHICRSYQI